MKRTPYELSLASHVSGTRPTYRFRTADGVVSKQSFRTAELLLLEGLWDASLGRLLDPEANYGVVGTVLADAADSVAMTESSTRAAQLCERNVRENDADASVSVVSDLTTLDSEFDTVAYAPKRYTPLSLGKQRIADALSVLRPEGRLYLAASKQTGLTRYDACLNEIATDISYLSERNGYHLLEATRPESVTPPAYVSPRFLQPTVNGIDLELITVPGVFSASGLDDGTRLLMETVDIDDGERVLDLCCGYGAIGVYAARIADCDVWLSDDNKLATHCAKNSLCASRVEGTVVTADCVEGVSRTFDSVLCNPPTHAGSGVLSELFAGIDDVLAPDGQLTIVHHRELDLRNYLSFSANGVRRTGTNHIVQSYRPR